MSIQRRCLDENKQNQFRAHFTRRITKNIPPKRRASDPRCFLSDQNNQQQHDDGTPSSVAKLGLSNEELEELDDDDEKEKEYTLTAEEMSEIERGQPSQWLVFQQLFGINIFTYILAAAIAFFLSLNLLLGPGWLGNSIGIPGTGSFTEIADPLPDEIDLSGEEFRLQ